VDQKPAVRVQVDPQSLAGRAHARGRAQRSRGRDVNQPKGNIDGARQDYALATNDQLYKADGFKPLVLAYTNGSPVRLADVANSWTAWERPARGWRTTSARSSQRPAQPGANGSGGDRVKALLPQLQSPAARIDVKILSDRTETVKRRSRRRAHAGHHGGPRRRGHLCLLAQRPRDGDPSIAVPLSLVGTFGVMYLVGYSLNNLSLMALTNRDGFVVDDAIVMIENIARYIEAATDVRSGPQGAAQIGFTIVSLTVSLIAVSFLCSSWGPLGRPLSRVRGHPRRVDRGCRRCCR